MNFGTPKLWCLAYSCGDDSPWDSGYTTEYFGVCTGCAGCTRKKVFGHPHRHADGSGHPIHGNQDLPPEEKCELPTQAAQNGAGCARKKIRGQNVGTDLKNEPPAPGPPRPCATPLPPRAGHRRRFVMGQRLMDQPKTHKGPARGKWDMERMATSRAPDAPRPARALWPIHTGVRARALARPTRAPWPTPYAPLCDIPSGCCSFTAPWTVTRSSLRMLRRVAAFCRPLRPVLLLVSFPRSRSPVVGVLGLC